MCHVAQSVERRTLDVEVKGSKPPTGAPGGRVVFHLICSVGSELRGSRCQVLDQQTLELTINRIMEDSKIGPRY